MWKYGLDTTSQLIDHLLKQGYREISLKPLTCNAMISVYAKGCRGPVGTYDPQTGTFAVTPF